jgi:hypothetical protein
MKMLGTATIDFQEISGEVVGELRYYASNYGFLICVALGKTPDPQISPTALLLTKLVIQSQDLMLATH